MSNTEQITESAAPILVDPYAVTRDLEKPTTRGKWQKFVSWIWDSYVSLYEVRRTVLLNSSDYYEKSAAERRLVFKLDCFMLTAMTLGW